MATSESWMNRKKGKQAGDLFKLDTKTKTPEQNVKEIIHGLYLKKLNQNDMSPNHTSRRLSYLNALVTLLCKEDKNCLGFTSEELMICIRISLVDESMVIRAAALRVLRYLIKNESDIATFNTLKLPYLVIRSMDLMLRNEEERAQAFRIVRRVIAVVGGQPANRKYRAAYIEPGLLRCLAAIARAGNAGDGSGDRLARPAIATLAEIGVMSPALLVSCGGINAMIRFLGECATPRMAEALCGALLHTLDSPHARRMARLDLKSLCAPYCDFHLKPTADSARDEREMRFTCSRLALLCVLRSWSGLLHFCHPYSSGGLKALVQALHLPRLEVRKAILDLLYELLGLPQPEWTDEISVALGAVDPSDFQDSWRLNEGFVAAEGTSILPHLSANGPDITEIHLALLLQCFLEAGLLDGLAEVIVTSDTFISVRATVLLGQLLHLIHILLPPQICSATPALPSLISQAAAGKPQALAAIAALKKLHSMLEARPATNSLFLDHIIQYCAGAFREKAEDTSKSRKEKDNQKVTKSTKFFNLFERDSDSLIRCSSVMQNKDGNQWNWDIIRTILKEHDSSPLLNLNDSGHKAWISRIINYLKPSSNKYSHADLSVTCHGHTATRAGCQLVRHMLKHNDPDSQRLLEELFEDVSRQVLAIETGRKAHECLFSPQHMCNTMCQMYFLFVGQLCHSENGLKLFKQTRLYENLLDLSTKTHHNCYVKLVISSLDYTIDSYPRDILAKTLTCSIQASRLYSTQFLRVLLRASQKSRELVRRKMKARKNGLQEHVKSTKEDAEHSNNDMETWILQMLIGQVKDESKEVVRCAISILEEACSLSPYLEKLIAMKELVAKNCRFDKSLEPNALDLSVAGDKGYLLWLHLEVASLVNNSDQQNIAFVKKHLDYWTRFYNYRYVRLVEAEIHSALTLGGAAALGGREAREAGEAREARARSGARRGALCLTHLHALLAASEPARPLLRPALTPHYKILKLARCSTEQEIMDLKATLWAISNVATCAQGVQMLMQLSSGGMEDSVPVLIVRLAKFCPVYSIRAAAFYSLGLIGTTYVGANLLYELGWLCVRHTRHDQFPIVEEENLPSEGGTGNLHHLITSPTRAACRYLPRPYDTDISEHSDHTDHSAAESLHSDHKNEHSRKEHDAVDGKCKERKSHTLPGGYSTLHERPSLTESRTLDVLRDCSNFERSVLHGPIVENRLAGRINSLDTHEGRVRNTSESSTSGVSSCDSVLGRYTFPDRVLTLSPIPSSSSLYGMKGSSQRSRMSESQRRTSTSSFTAPDAASSPPSQKDMVGYATLKSLNRNRTPHLSESAVTGSTDIEELSWIVNESTRRTKPFSSLRDRSKAIRERVAKFSLLEYDWKPMGAEGVSAGGAETSRTSRSVRGGRCVRWTSGTRGTRGTRTTAGGGRGARVLVPPTDRACYIGVCLPYNIMDLFPRGEGDESTLDSFADETSFLLDSAAAIDAKLHTSNENTSCNNYKCTGTGVVVGGGTVEPGWSHAAGNCLACARTRPASTHQLREAFFAHSNPNQKQPVSTEGYGCPQMDRSTPQAEVLYHARYMSNPIHHKQTRPALLVLKQRYPEIFRSVCVYSEVSYLLSTGTYMMCARRFLQELFLDAPFECFSQEPREILARHKLSTSPTAPPDTALKE